MTTQSPETDLPYFIDPQTPDLYWSEEAQAEHELRQQALHELAGQKDPRVLVVTPEKLRAKIQEIKARKQIDR